MQFHLDVLQGLQAGPLPLGALGVGPDDSADIRDVPEEVELALVERLRGARQAVHDALGERFEHVEQRRWRKRVELYGMRRNLRRTSTQLAVAQISQFDSLFPQKFNLRIQYTEVYVSNYSFVLMSI